jgi:CRP/FNR family cyclic AMP-dependent transcriptional regulator
LHELQAEAGGLLLQFISARAQGFQCDQPPNHISAGCNTVCRRAEFAGVFLLCSGKVKLSTSSRDGKVLILKMAGPGEMLGLSAVISGTEYELTAETAMPCQVNFVAREPLLELLQRHGEAGLRSAQALSREFQSAYRDIHDLILARSSAGKLAKLLLSWTPPSENNTKEIRVSSGLTHEEMAQTIGASRETVTRLLSDLRKKQLIQLEGSTLVIRNRMALEALVS